MKFDNLWLVLIGVVVPFLCAYGIVHVIKSHEKVYRGFYWALREKHPKSYVKQNSIVKAIRKFFKLRTDEKIYWIYCFYHYMQAIMLIGSISMLILPWFIPFEKVVGISFIVGLVPFSLIAMIDIIFLFIRRLQCEKIKKENPKYSKRIYNQYRYAYWDKDD